MENKTDEKEVLYLTDHQNVICLPYTPANMKKMAKELGLKQSWFKEDRYVIPDNVVVDEVVEKCGEVTSQTLFRSLHKIM